MSSSGGSQAPASDRYGLLRRPAAAAWDQISEIGSASQADTTQDKFEFESNASNERRAVLRPHTAGSRALPGLPRSAARPVVGGSAGRLRELSAQRPGSAGGAHAVSSSGLQQQLAREEAARALADRPKSVEPDILQHLAREESARALADRPHSVDPDMLIGGAFVDHKSSFYSAVREYEKNLATLRKERDAMLDELTPLRRQLEDANISVRALEAERKQLLAVRERSTAAAGALHETIEKLAEMQRRTRSLEKQVQDSDADWKQERQRLTSRAEAAERRAAELASNIALHERAALSQNEAAATDAKRIQAQHSKQYEALEEQARQAQKSLKDAQETERAASKSAQDWQQHAAALERQLKHAHTLASEGTDSLRSKLSQCAEALEQTEAELIKTRAQHAADTQKKEQLYSTRAQHMSQEHQASPKN